MVAMNQRLLCLSLFPILLFTHSLALSLYIYIIGNPNLVLQFITGPLEAGDFLFVWRLPDHKELWVDVINRNEN